MTNHSMSATLYEFIAWRKSHGLTQAQAGEVFGVSLSTVSKWEAGQRTLGGSAGVLLKILTTGKIPAIS